MQTLSTKPELATARTKRRPSAHAFGDHVEQRLRASLATFFASPEWQSVAAPEADPRYVLAVTKYLLLEVFSYGPHVTEATFTSIGRLPKTRPDLMKPMIIHDLSEVDHGEMALEDFVKLGGNEQWARTRQITPASFVMSATCRMIGERQDFFVDLY